MPYHMRRLKSGQVRVTSPHGVRAKATTPRKAKAQVRLLRAIKHNPSFKPRRAR